MKILVLGGDERYISLMNNLQEDIDCVGYEQIHLNSNIKKVSFLDVDFSLYDKIILPILGITSDLEIQTLNKVIKIDRHTFDICKKDCVFYIGVVNETMKELLKGKKIVRFLADEKVQMANDVLTLQGVLKDIETKKKDNIVILGYGNLGSKLAALLSSYHVKIGVKDEDLAHVFSDTFFLTRFKDQMKAHFKESDIVINTVPSNIMDKETLDEATYVLDIASFPYGVSKEVGEKHENYKLYSSIPSKYAPSEAGKILAKKIKRDIGGNV